MLEGQGLPVRAHHLVGVAAMSMPMVVAPGANADTAGAPPRVPAQLDRRRCQIEKMGTYLPDHGNRRSGLYTLDRSGSAWIQNFNNGNQNNNNKDWNNRVRAVRT